VGKTDVQIALGKEDGGPVHELDGGRHHLRLPEDPGNEGDGALRVGKGYQKIHHPCRKRKELEDDLRHHRKGSLGAHKQMDEVVSRHVLAALASEPGDGAIRKHRFESQHRGAGGTIFHHLVSPRVFRHVAADEGGITAAGVSRVEEPRCAGRLGDLRRDDTGLHGDGEIVRIQFENAVHLLEGQHDAVMQWNRAAGKSRSGTPGCDGNTPLVRQGKNGCHMLRRFRKNHHLRHVLAVPIPPIHFVVGIDLALFPVRGHVSHAHDGFERCQDFRRHLRIVVHVSSSFHTQGSVSPRRKEDFPVPLPAGRNFPSLPPFKTFFPFALYAHRKARKRTLLRFLMRFCGVAHRSPWRKTGILKVSRCINRMFRKIDTDEATRRAPAGGEYTALHTMNTE
jgi:hypothetical protein